MFILIPSDCCIVPQKRYTNTHSVQHNRNTERHIFPLVVRFGGARFGFISRGFEISSQTVVFLYIYFFIWGESKDKDNEAKFKIFLKTSAVSPGSRNCDQDAGTAICQK